MYYRQHLVCKHCGHSINLIRKILTNKEFEHFRDIKEVCPCCGRTMISSEIRPLKRPFTITDDDYLAIGEIKIAFINPLEIRIDLGALANAGFTGVLSINSWDNEEIMFDFNPIKREVIRYDQSAKRKKTKIKNIRV